MAQLTLKGVGKTYAGGVQAVSGVDIDIADGEFIVLVGPSGCGKSTLLRMVAGLETVTHGEIHIGDRLVNTIDPAERDIAMVFQNYALYPHMSVRDNMAYGLKNRGTPKPEIAQRVAEAARMLELGDYLDRKPRALSGGQRQRVAMGRAIVRQPAAFLFDEPLSNLDAALRVEMRLEIAKLHQRLGATMVYVTHDQVEAMTLADRIVVLNGGDIQQVGSPLDLYDTPANLFVAQFIGSPNMNVFDVTPVEGGVRLGNGTVLPGPAEARHLGIRPEHVEIVEDDGDVTATAQLVERLGSDTNIYTDIDGAGPLLVRVSGNVGLKPGERVTLRYNPARLHFFGADGAALPRT